MKRSRGSGGDDDRSTTKQSLSSDSTPRFVPCPICSKTVPYYHMDSHVEMCLQQASTEKLQPHQSSSSQPTKKRKTPLGEKHTPSKENINTYDTPPLAERIRPTQFDQVRGQDDIFGPSKLLRLLIQSDRVPSMILYGPPGSGKTTIARLVAQHTNSKFITLSATASGVSDVRQIISNARKESRLLKNRKTILFVDEIHRFNKSQQDIFLPSIEDGTIRLLGATTENPSFEVNSALLSRCKVFVLKPHSLDSIKDILKVGMKEVGLKLEEDALSYLATQASGDARVALNSLEILSAASSDKTSIITLNDICDSLQRSHVTYDRGGDSHYDTISALHKSIRGSDDNASLYWLMRMLQGGESPLYIARRLVRVAAEDIGLADPKALDLAVSTFNACHALGMPECDVILAQCTVYLARASKSVEVYKAMKAVKTVLRTSSLPPVPLHLRNAPTKLLKEMGYGFGYKYNPDYKDDPKALESQTYIPTQLEGINFFE